MERIKQQSYTFNDWLYRFSWGTGIGLVNATAATPFMALSNHILNKKSTTPGKSAANPTLARAFDGMLSYHASFVLRISVALPLNSFFLHHLSAYCQINEKHKSATSILAGGGAGAVATLSEAIAQTKQLSTPKPSTRYIIQQAYHHNGLFGLTRGMAAMVVRTAGLTAGYLSLMPLFCKEMRQHLVDNVLADVFSAMVCGLVVNTFTTPFNTLRFEMQKNFIKPSTPPTYRALLRQACKSPQDFLMLFNGFGARLPMTMLSMLIIAKGNELGQVYSEEGFPDFPSLRFN
jgi:hypothetical protein